MNKTPRFSALLSLVLTLVAGASFVQAQTAPVTVRSSRTDRGSVAPGGVFTSPFTIVNTTNDSIAAAQVIMLPAGWTTVNSMAPSMLAPKSMELWLVSVAAPSGAAAGVYVFRAGIRSGDVVASDSVVVAIEERYEINVRPSKSPTYVLAGDAYEATFIVHNRGNVVTRIALKATSNRGSVPKLSAAVIELAPGATTSITASVKVPTDAIRSVQDLLEIIAVDAARDSVRAESSVETTIIAKGNGGADYWTVPGEFAVRAGMPGAGVSPFIASGSGRISEKSDATVDFSVRTAPGTASIFGERDEYRFGLRTKQASLRVGDDSYGFSRLTASGGQGTGGELIGARGSLVAGAYVQRNRWTMNTGTETAAMLGTSTASDNAATVVLLQRANGVGSARVLAGSAQSKLLGSNIELEAAQSDSQTVGGGAAMFRVFGKAAGLSYDIGGQRASNTFAGAQRASSDQHVTVSGHEIGPLTLSAMTSIHSTNPTTVSNGFGQRIATSSLSGTFTNGSAIEYDRFDRADRGTNGGIRGNQQSLRFRGRLAKGAFDMLGTIQTGIVSQADTTSRAFTTMSGSLRAVVGRDQYLSAFGEVTDGQGLGAGGVGTITGGTSAELHLARATSLRMTTSVTTQRDRLSDWVGQADITVERAIRQSIVALRGRIAESGSAAIPSANAFYIEVRTPLRVPTARLNVGGRARARVVDVETGRGVAGALVRMGEQAAVTDKNGTASFKGLETGEYHAVVEGGIAAGQLVSGGAVSVVASAKPTMFTMSVARGARVAASLRRFEKASAAIVPNGGEADSVLDVGGVSQAVVALISARDTIWQSSDDRGRIDFGSIAPGHYTMKIVAGDIPEFTVFEKKEVDIDVVAGETREVALRLIPQARAVQFVNEETVLIAAPTKSVPAPRAAPTRQQR